ncbi:hypothetical protein KC359_g19 [Hortaea werneckii]|nr:hypothetical protein KC359_g19 [Hortaea werneckii]
MLRPKIHPAPCSPAGYDCAKLVPVNHLDKWLLLHHQTFWLARYLSCDWRSVQRDGNANYASQLGRRAIIKQPPPPCRLSPDDGPLMQCALLVMSPDVRTNFASVCRQTSENENELLRTH